MFGFFLEKGLISVNQWGFKPGDSCINQLLSITHDIYKSFDKVWHDGLIIGLQKKLDIR